MASEVRQTLDEVVRQVAQRYEVLGRLLSCRPQDFSFTILELREGELYGKLERIASAAEADPTEATEAEAIRRLIEEVYRVFFIPLCGTPPPAPFLIPDRFYQQRIGRICNRARLRVIPESDLLSVEGAYKVLGKQRPVVYRLSDAGRLHPLFTDEGRRFDRREVLNAQEFLDGHEERSRPFSQDGLFYDGEHIPSALLRQGIDDTLRQVAQRYEDLGRLLSRRPQGFSFTILELREGRLNRTIEEIASVLQADAPLSTDAIRDLFGQVWQILFVPLYRSPGLTPFLLPDPFQQGTLGSLFNRVRLRSIPADELLSVESSAKQLGKQRPEIYRLCDAGLLHPVSVEGRSRFDRQEVIQAQEFLEELRYKQPAQSPPLLAAPSEAKI